MKTSKALHNYVQSGLWLIVHLIVTAKGSYDFPTYPHPTYPNQLCYMCPPGYKKITDCVADKNAFPNWPICKECGSGEYMDMWNIDPRCKSQRQCRSSQVVCGEPSVVSNAECTCHSSSIENLLGECVKGVPKFEYDKDIDAKDEQMKQCEQTLSSLQKSLVTATPKPTQKSTSTPVLLQPSRYRADTGTVVLIVAVVALSICLLLSILVNVYQWRKRKADDQIVREDGEPVVMPDDNPVEETRERPPPRVEQILQQQTSDNSDESAPLLPNNDSTDGDTSNSSHDQEIKKKLDPAFNILEKSVMSSENDLDKIMRDIFKFEFTVCDSIKAEFKGVTNQLRHAFAKWIRRESNAATAENLVLALGEHQWNDEADKIAKLYGITREEVKPNVADRQLEAGFKICESLCRRDIPAFVRKCFEVEIEEFCSGNETNVDILRKAFKAWKRKNSSKATVDNLIKQLLLNGYKFIAEEIIEKLKESNKNGNDTSGTVKVQEPKPKADDKITRLYDSVHSQVTTDNGNEELNNAIKVCERKIANDAQHFIQKYLRIEDGMTDKDSAYIFQYGFNKWKKKYTSKAAWDDLIRLLMNSKYRNTAQEILEDLQERTSQKYESQKKKLFIEDVKGGSRKAFFTEGEPVEKNEAGPSYPPGAHHSDEPVRETTQPTTDVTQQSYDQNHQISSQEDPEATNMDNNPNTVPKSLYASGGQTATSDERDEDVPGTTKVQDERCGHVVVDVVQVDDGAGDGGKSVNQTGENPS